MLLEVSNISVDYGGVNALRNISLKVEEGELVSVIGANGAGKTTLLNAIMGWNPPREGEIFFQGNTVTRLPSYLRARRGIRIVPEKARVFPDLTVEENIRMGSYGLSKSLQLSKRLDDFYDIFPILKTRGSQLAKTLSGGEQQQLAITRACVSDPKILLVDEVSMGLMPRLVDSVFELLSERNRKDGLTILLVEQNALASLKIAQRGYVLETGELVLEGRSEDLLNNNKVQEAYLGVS